MPLHESLPPVTHPTLDDMYAQQARIRAVVLGRQAQAGRGRTIDFTVPHLEAMISEKKEAQLGAIALSLSVTATEAYPLPVEKS